MSSRSAVILCLIILWIIHCKQTIATNIIELDTGSVPIEWKTFSIRKCANRIHHNLFKCLCSIDQVILPDERCLYEKTLEFNNASCRIKQPSLTVPGSTIFECPDENFIGVNCDIPSHPCGNPKLCQNGGTCLVDEDLGHQYRCQCPKGYSGDHCEIDDRICKENTCWHDGKCEEMQQIVALVNETTFQCDCKAGYDGIRCETAENMCANINCQNNAVCFSSYPTWTCVCLDASLYSGTYCEHKSTALVIRQVLSKSFASIAITAIILVFLFVTIMDLLKYAFKIDPVDHERRLMQLEEEKSKKKKKKKSSSLKFYYIS